ncbi:MAG: hypothetical protein ABI042_16880 [Verrucomicrobiota bacterium]
MSTRAKVTSVEALESFRTNLIVYLSKARPTLEEVSDAVIRTRVWLESDRRVFWENQVRRLRQKLQEAQQAVFSAELSSLREVSTAERMGVQKAKRAYEEGEAKLALVKKWNRNFANQVEPMARQLEKLQTVFATNLPLAIAYLSQAVKTLHDYSDVIPLSENAPPPKVATDEKKS